MSIKNTIQRAKNARTWMKNNRQLLLLLLAIVIMLILGGCIAGEHSAMLAMVIAGVADGKHVVDEPLTTDLANETSPGLLLNEIDQQIVKVRPMATPIDQLSRCAGSKHAGSMIVDYYNVDTIITKNIQSLDIIVRYVLFCLFYDCIKSIFCPLNITFFAKVHSNRTHYIFIMVYCIAANVHTYHNPNSFNQSAI